jgi:hypothetical protein
MIMTSTEPSRPAVERSPPTGGRLQIGMAEIKSESVADFISESVADLLRNQQIAYPSHLEYIKISQSRALVGHPK